ncbi:Minor extracellular protease vpr [Colletotrichum orbiculare MAFF 240422]|uniref:Minor extracellular protease vpr n=1 Tax=Colletotrichum orbiculare (strain 104-T / ATCC 96160 / CBS 514.97 / LARS 414 / MAFF 240422) TaxID=1213857 RepID=N4VS69_COLOR|nr:Minor extracellular protease vpr [Colletotrichum orbiculare MAFF 240422]
MRAGIALVSLLAAGATSALEGFPRRSINTTGADDAVPRRYIVELRSRQHGSRIAKTSAIPGVRILKHFDSDIFPGVAVECDRACTADSVRAAFETSDEESVVASVYKSQMLQLLPTIEGEAFSDDAAAVNYSVHGLTGVEELHEDGILGEGAVVAIVDSGVQYTHPALGGGIGESFTVAGGYDLVGDDWPDAPAQPDNDPMDRFGHGTHVAGIIAGRSEQFVGVAPKAKLLSFKVFGSSGYSNEETVIEGFLRAFDSGADIISASVGEGSGFTNNALAVVASRIVDNGVVVVFAAGNSGESGPFAMANGASGEHVLTVAASDPGVFPAQAFSASFNLDGTPSNTTRIAYVPGTDYFPDTVANWPVTPLTLNSSVENDACSALPESTPSLNGSVVLLVRLGGCTTTTKHSNVAAAGARYVLFYNNLDVYQSPLSSGRVGLTGVIEAPAGEAIVATLRAGGSVTASFDVDTANYVGIRNAGGGRPARYSSWGGTYDLALKPDVAAPGTRILSTYPTDAYRVLSGTSMATPYISGIAALWVGEFGGRAAHKEDPAWARRLVARITTTGRAVPWADWATSPADYGFWAPTTQVGGGFVDARRVLRYTTDLGFDGRKIELNDTAHFAGRHVVDVTNRGEEKVTYRFSVQDAGGYEAYVPSVPGEERSFIPAVPLYPEVNPVKMTPDVVLPDEVEVGPGETKAVEFSFTAPEGVNASRLPVYSGKVLISGSNGEELGVPYFGVGSDLNKTIENVWAYGWNTPVITSTPYSVHIEQKSNFTFNLTRAAADFPQLTVNLLWGTQQLRWDIFETDYTEAEWSYPPVVGEKGFVGSATSWNDTASGSFDPGEDSEDDLFSFPLYTQPRQRYGYYAWLGRLANGSQITPGSYQFRIAALRPFGLPEHSEDWDIWQTPLVTVLPMEV